MCIFPSKLAAIKVPISAKGAAFVAGCKKNGKNVVLEIMRWRKNGSN